MEQIVKEQLKVILSIAIDDYIAKISDTGIDFCLPDNIETLMSDAAFSVLEAVEMTNKHYREHHMEQEPPDEIQPGLNASHN